jgi:hypothetical protein|tara:strand:+ start:814 stop:1968 length:1155 start_codon:yes stop_codon:yes gene_type:complete
MTSITSQDRQLPCLRKTVAFAVLCLLLTFISTVAHAAENYEDRLYRVDQQVADQSGENRRLAAQDALLTVLSRLTGLASIPRSGVVNAALKFPDRYYSKFDYVRGQDRDRSAQMLSIRFTFQAESVLALVRQAGLPIWWTKRPQTVVWVVVDEPGQRRILGADDASPLVQGILAQADLRGLPVALPLMDLDDSILISVSDVWGKFTEALNVASARYGAAQYLIGRFSVQEILGERLYSGEWQLMKVQADEKPSDIFKANNSRAFLAVGVRGFQAQKITEIAQAAVDMAATSLAEEYAIFGRDPQNHLVSVSGLNNLQSYSALVAYLQEFEFVERVNVLALQDDVISLQILSSATLERLVSLLAMEGRLTNLTTVDTQPLLGWQG